jgi:hypothetical protein
MELQQATSRGVNTDMNHQHLRETDGEAESSHLLDAQ